MPGNSHRNDPPFVQYFLSYQLLYFQEIFLNAQFLRENGPSEVHYETKLSRTTFHVHNYVMIIHAYERLGIVKYHNCCQL